MKIQIKALINLKRILFWSALLLLVRSTSYSYSQCNSSAYLNTANLQCVACQSNQIANLYQSVAISCQCTSGYIFGTNGAACSAAFNNVCAVSNSYYPIYNTDGSVSSTTTANCIACDSTAYTNQYTLV